MPIPRPPDVDLAALPDLNLADLANGLATSVPTPKLDPLAACTAALLNGAGAATSRLREVLRQAAARDHLRELMQRAVEAGVRMGRDKQGRLQFVTKGTVDVGLMAELH